MKIDFCFSIVAKVIVTQQKNVQRSCSLLCRLKRDFWGWDRKNGINFINSLAAIWRFFTVHPNNPKFAQCNECKQFYLYLNAENKPRMGNLHTHLFNMHMDLLKKFKALTRASARPEPGYFFSIVVDATSIHSNNTKCNAVRGLQKHQARTPSLEL